MRTVEDILTLMGGPEAAATRCGVGTEAIRKWRQARAIPARHWPAVIAATGLALADLPGAPAPAPTAPEPETPPMPDSAAAAAAPPDTVPEGATAALVLGDGTVLWGIGFGAHATTVGEVCFNTGMTGYQETLTDPSYAGQIITFTFPHIGNVGANAEDIEAATPAARGLIVKQDLTEPANWRARWHLDGWLKSHGVAGIAGIDTRALTARIRDGGAPNGVLCFPADRRFDLAALRAQAKAWPGLVGMDLAKEVSCRQTYRWNETEWSWPHAPRPPARPGPTSRPPSLTTGAAPAPGRRWPGGRAARSGCRCRSSRGPRSSRAPP